MSRPQIRYQSGYKYQLVGGYLHHLSHGAWPVDVPSLEGNEFVWLDNFDLRICPGYAWDGPSGPTFDTKAFMRGSLVHDALYQLIRMNPQAPRRGELRAAADLELHHICRADGMSQFRAWYVYRGVRMFGASAADGKREVLSAP